MITPAWPAVPGYDHTDDTLEIAFHILKGRI
jgi:hypothetical protein